MNCNTITEANLFSTAKEMVINSAIILEQQSLFEENIGIYKINRGSIELTDEFTLNTQNWLAKLELTQSIEKLIDLTAPTPKGVGFQRSLILYEPLSESSN